MGGIIGRLFREFAICVSVAVAVSGVISLTMTPMLCAWLLNEPSAKTHGRVYRLAEGAFDVMLSTYRVGARSCPAPARADSGRHAGDHGRDHLAVRDRTEGPVPTAGHRSDHRCRQSRPRCFLRCNVRTHSAPRPYCHDRSGCRQRALLDRPGRDAEPGPHAHQPQTVRQSRCDGDTGHEPTEAEGRRR